MHNVSLRNWASTHCAVPAFYHEPSSAAEVASILRCASLRGSTLRVIGSGHSPSSCAMAHGPGCEMLSLRLLCRVHSVDAASGEVDVDAGITLAALGCALAREGLALPNLGSIDAQTVGGCIATGTHGTGIRDGALSSCITSLTLVTAGGELREVRGGDPLLPAALCSLGLLGVVVRVRLRAVPAFHLRVREGPADLEELLCDLPARIASARFCAFFFLLAPAEQV
jgi:FAD/FMN-containing dehydrogenase